MKKNEKKFGKFKKGLYLCIVLGEILTCKQIFKQTNKIFIIMTLEKVTNHNITRNGFNVIVTTDLNGVGQITTTFNVNSREEYEIKDVSQTPLSYYRGVISITVGKVCDADRWLFSSKVMEYDFTPIPKSTPLLLDYVSNRTHYLKVGGEPRGVYSAPIFYCQNMSLTYWQAKKMGIVVPIASGHKKNGRWSYDELEFSLAKGWKYDKLNLVTSDKVDLSRNEDGLCEYFNVPKNIGFGEFCLAEGEKFQELYETALNVTAAVTAIDTKEETGQQADTIVEHRFGWANKELLIDGEVWDYVGNPLHEKVTVLHRASDLFTLCIKAGCKVEIVNGVRYNRFDNSDCLYNRGYRRVNGLWQKVEEHQA